MTLTKRQVFILVGFVIILVAIPLTLYLVRQTQIFAPRAAFIPKIEFVDATGKVITETTSPNVKLKITKEEAASSPTPSPSPSPSVPPIPADPRLDTSYDINVLVIKYFPLTANGQNINIDITGDVGEPFAIVRQRTIEVTLALKNALERGTTYLGYKNQSATPALRYSIVDTKEYTQAVPIQLGSTNKPNLDKIMKDHNICNYVDNSGVKEVWLWVYQGPGPQLAISESQLILGNIHSNISPTFNPFAGFVDIIDGIPGFANGPFYPAPRCQSTYRIYSFNYLGKTGSAFESWGHQIERELRMTDLNLFVDLWQGEPFPQTKGVSGRCGSVHNPPNAREEYDRANPNPQKSDCLDWNPDGLEQLTDISCQIWGCSIVDEITNEPSLNYMIWNWQNLPGRNNIKTYQGKKLRNWWDIHGDFDNVMRNSKRLTL